jgi:hypothetical protein
MNINELKRMVESDLDIDSTELGAEALKSPQLHNKYLCFLLDEKHVLSLMESAMKIVERDKWLYYTGKISDEDLKRNNWEPFELALVKQDVDRFIESDKQYADMLIKLNQQKEKINYLENVVKIMSNRAWNIKSAIEWNKFTQGIS